MGGRSSRMPRRLLFVGLPNAGKSAVLRSFATQLRLEQITSTTLAPNATVESVEFRNVILTAFAVGEGRRVWRNYASSAQAVVFVVDSAERLEEARDELHALLAETNVPCLVLANKQDVEGAATPAELIDRLCLVRLPQRWHVQPCVATRGDGLFEGLDWLSSVLTDAVTPKHRHFDGDSPFDCLVAPFAVVFGPKRGPNLLNSTVRLFFHS